MSKRIRECGPIKQTGLGISSLREKTDWTRANIADGTWTLNDPDTTLSGVTNINGINQVVIGTDNNDEVIDGGVHYKQVLNADGSPLDFTDKPVMIEFYIHWPHCGWQVNNPAYASGGLGRPTVASKCYTVAGIMTDPENLPATAGASEFPTDILGFGIETRGNVQKQRYLRIRNNGTGAPRGTLELGGSELGTAPSDGDYDSDGRKTNANRVSWFARLAKNDGASGTGAINVAGEPMVDEVSWEKYYDDGDKWATPVEWIVSQRFGRVRTDKLYVWISSGRGASGAGSPVTVDFDVYYRIVALDGGVSPSGRTGLAS